MLVVLEEYDQNQDPDATKVFVNGCMGRCALQRTVREGKVEHHRQLIPPAADSAARPRLALATTHEDNVWEGFVWIVDRVMALTISKRKKGMQLSMQKEEQ
jgi:hypothetical protein